MISYILIKMTEVIEKDYDKLLTEFNDYKTESEEIIKEYESTIKVLNLNIETLKGQNSSLTNEIDIIKANNKSLAKEVEGYKNKNAEKMKDIELLNQQYDKLNKKYQEVIIEKEAINSKVVSLENDNDLYIKKIRQLESTNNDLTAKYESALEDLITNQTEFTNYKEKSEEMIQRLKQDVNDTKDNVDVIKREYERKNSVSSEKMMNEIKKNMNVEELIEKMKKRKKELQTFKNNIKNEIKHLNLNM